ncbi:MAG TPA: DUF1493 family protein [Terriglobales bacterium]|nr:DUF1493 family protein [Terriglobales bacterium]
MTSTKTSSERELPDETEEKLLSVLRRFVGRASVTRETCLFHDLHISGDDAADFLTELHRTFGTNFERFSFADYFPHEGEAVLTWLALRLGLWSSLKRLSVGHILHVIEAGAWFEPHENLPHNLAPGA